MHSMRIFRDVGNDLLAQDFEGLEGLLDPPPLDFPLPPPPPAVITVPVMHPIAKNAKYIMPAGWLIDFGIIGGRLKETDPLL